MKVAVSSAAGLGLYSTIPASSLREFVDAAASPFAKFPQADIPPFGKWHRYARGHDMLIDVPATFRERGAVDGVRHGGHVILTDFPTRDGIPIPGFSESGLGRVLVEHGIPKGWLNVNIAEGAFGYLAIAEGSTDLLAAASGQLDMCTATFFDTYAEGTVEVALGLGTENPFLVMGGAENILAGIVSTWQTYTIDVDPLQFFGGALGSALLGALLTFALARGETVSGRARQSLCNAVRSGSVGAAFSIESAFGFGALLGIASAGLGRALAARHERERQMFFSVNQDQVERFLEVLGQGDGAFLDQWRAIRPGATLLDSPALLASDFRPAFSTAARELNTRASELVTAPSLLDCRAATLLDSTASRLDADAPASDFCSPGACTRNKG